MVKAKIAINGYGTIGKRVGDAVSAQDDMEIVGVVKTRPSFEAKLAEDRGFNVYASTSDKIEAFSNIDASHLFNFLGGDLRGELPDNINATIEVGRHIEEKMGGYGLEVEVGEIGREDESGRGADQSHRNKQSLHVRVDFMGDKIHNNHNIEYLILRNTAVILLAYHCWVIIKTTLIG